MSGYRQISNRLAILLAWGLGLVAPPVQAQPLCTAGGEENSIVNVAGRTFLQSGDSLVEFSTATSACLTCHDGTIATSVLAQPSNQEGRGTTGSLFASRRAYETAGNNHPVDVPYPTGNAEYVAMNDLDARLVLRDDLVTCQTCHDNESEKDNSQAPVTRRGFCVSCHLK